MKLNFIENPNIPSKRVSAVIADYRIGEKSVKKLNEMGIKVILSCEIPSLYEAVKGHTDMMLHHLGKNKFVAAPEAYEYFVKTLPEADIIKGSAKLTDKYPYDIAYNAAAVGEKLFCRRDYTAPEILSKYESILNVKQGYSKCSICLVSKNAIITSDSGIYEIASAAGIDALKIREGYIRLEGLPHGFIGGASGLISNDTLAVNGNIDTHPDSGLMRAFCEKHGVNILSLNEGEIVDIGSIIPICE